MDPQWIKKRIANALPGAQIEVRDLTGTGNHFEARVIATVFADKTMVQRHQLVYAPLQDVLATGELHALALKTYASANEYTQT